MTSSCIEASGKVFLKIIHEHECLVNFQSVYIYRLYLKCYNGQQLN